MWGGCRESHVAKLTDRGAPKRTQAPFRESYISMSYDGRSGGIRTDDPSPFWEDQKRAGKNHRLLRVPRHGGKAVDGRSGDQVNRPRTIKYKAFPNISPTKDANIITAVKYKSSTCLE